MIFLTIINIRESKVLGFIRQAGEKMLDYYPKFEPECGLHVWNGMVNMNAFSAY